jgi:hypothetical protein
VHDHTSQNWNLKIKKNHPRLEVAENESIGVKWQVA